MDDGVIKFYEASGIIFNRVGKLFHYKERHKVRYNKLTSVDYAKDSKYIKKMLRFYINTFGDFLVSEKLVSDCFQFAINYQDFKLNIADFKRDYYFIYLEAVYNGCRGTKFYNHRR